ncbi:hypothetical protein NEFER03_1095 [Nematocida sp. LUAm3]|nr:hypothetical protein NEFER03_1095 [Nematocida sp. LUAm3]KAI5175300.1 hypothetical protein NEFER02_1229 [Nematocida sp. LUAm2]KAI5177743.1 hypothetical protein NEFER01_0967 [Nematocida sp. LUAm1]
MNKDYNGFVFSCKKKESSENPNRTSLSGRPMHVQKALFSFSMKAPLFRNREELVSANIEPIELLKNAIENAKESKVSAKRANTKKQVKKTVKKTVAPKEKKSTVNASKKREEVSMPFKFRVSIGAKESTEAKTVIKKKPAKEKLPKKIETLKKSKYITRDSFINSPVIPGVPPRFSFASSLASVMAEPDTPANAFADSNVYTAAPVYMPGNCSVSAIEEEHSIIEELEELPIKKKEESCMRRMTFGPESGILSTPAKIRRLSLDVFSSSKRRCSVFQERRESFLGYEDMCNGKVSPSNFHKHSNENQGASARIKQILIWATKYISNGHVKIEGVSNERLQSICSKYLKKIPSFSLPKTPVKTKTPIISEDAQAVLHTVQEEMYKTTLEIEKWERIYRDVSLSYKIVLPNFSSEEVLSGSQSFSIQSSQMISFEKTLLPVGSSEVLALCSRRMEELRGAISSSKYFILLSSEYVKRVCSSLLEAIHPHNKAKANAMLRVLCQITRKEQV